MNSPSRFYKKQLLKFDGLLLKFPTPQKLIEDLYLKAIIDSYPRILTVSGIHSFSENNIRNEFIRDFKEHSIYLKDYIQNKVIGIASENQANTLTYTQRTDIEFFSSFHSNIFVVECKRLSSAETRYLKGRIVDGNYKIDGMEKFINLIYSENDESAAMLSFVIKGKIADITAKLKSKVKNFHPATDMDSFINKSCCNWATSFQSTHVRTNQKNLHLSHLFLDFTTN